MFEFIHIDCIWITLLERVIIDIYIYILSFFNRHVDERNVCLTLKLIAQIVYQLSDDILIIYILYINNVWLVVS